MAEMMKPDLHMASAGFKEVWLKARSIPEDIDNIVEKLLMDSPLTHVDVRIWYALSRAIQEALVAERERCASVPEAVADVYESYDAFETAKEFREVAHAIRKGHTT